MYKFRENLPLQQAQGQDRLKKIRKLILDTLFPIECLSCAKEDVWLCDECLEKIKLDKTGLQDPDIYPFDLNGFFVATDWENKVLQDAIHKFKYSFSQELVEPLSKLLIKKLKFVFENNLIEKDLVVIPVPLHKKRYNWRGFNQAELLAKQVCQKFNLELDKNMVSRTKNTAPQMKQDKQGRVKNIKNAFKLSKEISIKNYLLIDDVVTTGNTMNEIAKILKNNGVKNVYGLALARG